MSLVLQEAQFRSQSMTLHCAQPGKDAWYDVQLVPSKDARHRTSPNNHWAVYAQFSRDGGAFQWATKLQGVSRATAYTKYRETINQRLANDYRPSPFARYSDLSVRHQKEAPDILAQLPKWNGFSAMFNSVVAYVSEQLGGSREPPMRVLSMLTYLAYTKPEGVLEAVDLVCALDDPLKARQQLCPTMHQWMLDASDKSLNASLVSLQDLCFELAI